VNRETQNVLLLFVGGAIIRISVDGAYLRYVKSWMQPGLLAAGGLLVLLSLVSIWREVLSRRSRPSVDGHDHGPRVAWLLLLPVFAIFLVAPPALGSYAASRAPAKVTQPASDFPPLPAGDPVHSTLTDFAVRAIWDHGRSLAGRRITMTGFVSPRRGGGFYLTRMVLICCAADAQPIRVTVRGAGQPYPTDSWVTVVGTYAGVERATKDEQVPVLGAESVVPISQPSQPYES